MSSVSPQIPQQHASNQSLAKNNPLLLTPRHFGKGNLSGLNYTFNTPFPFRDLRSEASMSKSVDNVGSNNFITRFRPPMVLPNIHILDGTGKTSEMNVANATMQPQSLSSSCIPTSKPCDILIHVDSDKDSTTSNSIGENISVQDISKSSFITNSNNNASPLTNSLSSGPLVSLSSFPNRTFLFRNNPKEPHKFLSNSFLRNQSAKRQPPITPALQLALGNQNEMRNRFLATAFPSGPLQLGKCSPNGSQDSNGVSFINVEASSTSSSSSLSGSTSLTSECDKESERNVIRMPVTGTIIGTVYQRIASKSAGLLYTPSSVKQTSVDESKSDSLSKMSSGSYSNRENLRRQIQRDVEELKKSTEFNTTLKANASNYPVCPLEVPTTFKPTSLKVDSRPDEKSRQSVPKPDNLNKETSKCSMGDSGLKYDPLSSACSSTVTSSDEADSDADDQGSTAEIETEEEENNLPSSTSHSPVSSRRKSTSSLPSRSVSRLSSRKTISDEDNESDKESTISIQSRVSLKDHKSSSKVRRPRPTSAGSVSERRATLSSVSDWGSDDGSMKNLLATLTTDKPGGVKSPLIASLFPRVPPTIRFITANEKLESLPWRFRRLLKWRMSVITPIIVKNTITRSGFRTSTQCSSLTELENGTSADWIGYFGRHCKAHVFRTIREHQKVNHFPGSFQLGRKDRLWRNLSRMQSKHGKKEYGFFPETFCLPAELKELKAVFDTEPSGKQKWIIKPPASARGIGIRVVHKWSQIPKQKSIIVQRYISDPYLIHGSKFDLRIYVYVTSFNPLRAYVYNDGLVRFASVPYSNSLHTLHNRFIHLTNYSINKCNAAGYVENNGEVSSTKTAHKWSLKDLWEYFDSIGIRSSHIINNIHDLVVKTLLAGESLIASDVEEYCRGSQCVHELFGFDVLLDADLKPWILECNISPSLHSDSKLDVQIKGALIRDVFNLAGFVLPRFSDILTDSGSGTSQSSQCDNSENNSCNGILQDPAFNWETCLTNAEQKKQDHYVNKATEQFSSFWNDKANRRESSRNTTKASPLPDRKILDSLNTADLRCLVATIDEFQRLGDFTRVLPPRDRDKHCHYMTLADEPIKYYNLLLWSYHYYYNEKDSPKGIEVLQTLCKKGHHLRRHSSLSYNRRS